MWARWDKAWGDHADTWTGAWPGVADCRAYGWYAKLTPRGWQPCSADDDGATEDLNALSVSASWNPISQKWLPKSQEHQPLCGDFVNIRFTDRSELIQSRGTNIVDEAGHSAVPPAAPSPAHPSQHASAMAQALRDLLAWAAMMGGWDAPCWDQAQRVLDRDTSRRHPAIDE